MKSLLTSIDFVYNKNGTLTPLELNTNTASEYGEGKLTVENFIQYTEGVYNHIELHNFLQLNSITKIKVIGRYGQEGFFKVFSLFYGYEFELIKISPDSNTIPVVEDTADTLIIRIAYNTYALIDDLYARDNYEFHNLIKEESFASPICFKENNLDTISEFMYSDNNTLPNYVIKPRTPGYAELDYPKVYRLELESELSTLKENLLDSEFIQQYEFNSNTSLIDERTFHLRSMNLLIGDSLEIINIHNYVSINILSTTNELLIYPSEIDSSTKQLDPLFASKYYPTYYTRKGFSYHHDEDDFVLKPDGSLIDFEDIGVGTQFKDVYFNEQIYNFSTGTPEDVNTFIIGSSSVENIQHSADGGIFTNITATHETYGEFSWYDGVSNRYLLDSQLTENEVIYTQSGFILPGDNLYIYDKALNTMVTLLVTAKTYEIKSIKVYNVGLGPNSEFFVQLNTNNTDLFLVQHNACNASDCNANGLSYGCESSECTSCGKYASNCLNCGGNSTTTCGEPEDEDDD